VEKNIWGRGIILWERGIRCGIRRYSGGVKKTCLLNKNRNRGINVSLGGIESGIKRGTTWNKHCEVVELCGLRNHEHVELCRIKIE
jgi:hypothetical protein